jgi:hypothetical protein
VLQAVGRTDVSLSKVTQSCGQFERVLTRLAFMFKTVRLCLSLMLCLTLCVAAMGQEPLTEAQIRHAEKVRKSLAHYDAGMKLDVQLNDGSHHIGKLNEIRSMSFSLVDLEGSQSEAIDYADVKRVRPDRNEYLSQQLGKSAKGIPKVASAGLIALAVVVVLWVVVK